MIQTATDICYSSWNRRFWEGTIA